MRRIERVLAYTVTAAALAALALQSAGVRVLPSARATPALPAAAAVDPAKIATCDIYQIVQRMVDGDAYKPAQTAEQERLRGVLAPMEADIDKMQKELESTQRELQAANPQDPGAQDKFKAFQARRDVYAAKREEYAAKRQSAMETYSGLVASHFSDAYTKVCAEAKKVATAEGFGYVVSQKKTVMEVHNPQQLVEEFLSRPMPVSPDGVDITELVRIAMKLPEQAPTPTPTPAPTTPAVPGAAAPATTPPPAATPGSPATPETPKK